MGAAFLINKSDSEVKGGGLPDAHVAVASGPFFGTLRADLRTS